MSNKLNDNWFEVWYVDGVGTTPAYLVVVTPDPQKPDGVIVLDINLNEVIYRGESYEQVHNWLTEDEFGFVNGRIY